MFASRLCRSWTTAHSCAESGSGPPSWASSIALSTLAAQVRSCRSKATCAFSSTLGAPRLSYVRVYYMKQQQSIATNRRNNSGQFSSENSAHFGTRTPEETKRASQGNMFPATPARVGRLQAADAQAFSSLAPCPNCGPEPGVPWSMLAFRPRSTTHATSRSASSIAGFSLLSRWLISEPPARRFVLRGVLQ